MSRNATQPARTTLATAVLGALLLTGLGATTPGLFAQEKPATQPATAATEPAMLVVADGVGEDGKLTMMVNKSQVVRTKLPYKTVSIANPEIADFNQVDQYTILVT